MMAQFTIEEIPEPATWIHDPNTAGNWQDPNNWISNNLPTASDTALVDNGGTASISSSTGSVQVDSLYVGNQARGSILQSGGTMTVGGSLTLGYTTGSSGTYTLSGGSLGATNQYVGDSGIGTFNQSGGTNTVGGSLYVGYQNGASGTYNLSGGVMAVGGSVSLGGTISRGLLNITGGSLTASGPIVLASAASSTGELKVAKAAYVEVGGLTINSGSGRSTKVAMELDANGNSLIRTTGAATLAGSLDLQRLGNYRPNQGDTFTLIMATNMSGAFDAITSNVPGLLLLDPNNPGLGYWPAFRSEVDPNADLVAIFQGAMLGDAGGDNKVNEADLGDLVSHWQNTGMGWQQGDFGGDGNVNEADLGDLVTNWGQSGLPPSAPPPPGAPAPIPEPASLALLALGGLAARCRRR
jgi:MYXO-CTERM domain-containing protein